MPVHNINKIAKLLGATVVGKTSDFPHGVHSSEYLVQEVQNIIKEANKTLKNEIIGEKDIHHLDEKVSSVLAKFQKTQEGKKFFKRLDF